ncbi:MAG: hypothetical protein LAO19_21885 [Acidobacteriia bacterium]|nr:hypothetical protein [Terriglobia bacterium]
MAKKGQHQAPETSPTNTTGNAPSPQSGKQGQGTQSGTNLAATRNATGPRTKLGKRRSSKNAIKFGIFSKATLLESESRAEYASLRAALWKSKQPGDEFEEILLDKMASNLWRQRRVLIAEGAEIRKNTEFLEFDRWQKKLEEAEEISQKVYQAAKPGIAPEPVGLVWSENLEALESSLEILCELKESFEAKGFDEDDEFKLKQIYGLWGVIHLRRTLQDDYMDWAVTENLTEEERTAGGYLTSDECKQNVADLVGAEIKWLKSHKKDLESSEAKRMEVEILRQCVPDSPGLDSLLRVSSNLTRDFDRMLTQYDHAQRMRRGQPPPPEINVKIS